jgi:hypothetical protein
VGLRRGLRGRQDDPAVVAGVTAEAVAPPRRVAGEGGWGWARVGERERGEQLRTRWRGRRRRMGEEGKRAPALLRRERFWLEVEESCWTVGWRSNDGLKETLFSVD